MYEKRVVISPLFAPSDTVALAAPNRNIISQSRMTMTTESNYFLPSVVALLFSVSRQEYAMNLLASNGKKHFASFAKKKKKKKLRPRAARHNGHIHR